MISSYHSDFKYMEHVNDIEELRWGLSGAADTIHDPLLGLRLSSGNRFQIQPSQKRLQAMSMTACITGYRFSILSLKDTAAAGFVVSRQNSKGRVDILATSTFTDLSHCQKKCWCELFTHGNCCLQLFWSLKFKAFLWSLQYSHAIQERFFFRKKNKIMQCFWLPDFAT